MSFYNKIYNTVYSTIYRTGKVILYSAVYSTRVRVTDQEVGPAGQRQSGAGAGRRFRVLFRIIEQDQELANILKSQLKSFSKKSFFYVYVF